MASIRGKSAMSDIELEELLAEQALDRGMLARMLPCSAPRGAWWPR